MCIKKSYHRINWLAKIFIKSEYYSETSNNGLSERLTTSVQWTNPMSPIAIPIEIVHLEPQTPLYSGRRTASMPPKDSNPYKTDEDQKHEHKSENDVKLWTSVTQSVHS